MRRASAADHGHRLSSARDQAREQPRRAAAGRHGSVRVAACFRPDPATQESGELPQGPGPLPGACISSRGTDEGSSQVLIDCLLGDPERTSDADRFQFAGVDQAVHGHL